MLINKSARVSKRGRAWSSACSWSCRCPGRGRRTPSARSTRTPSSRCAWPTSSASTTSGPSSTTSWRSTRTARGRTSSWPPRAAQTKRIRVGHGVVPCVPQYQSPIRVAERAAVLDIISGGRLELGTGRSATWPELSGFGADPDETKKTWDEFVRVIPKMWMQERFAWDGRMFSMPERADPAQAAAEAAPADVGGGDVAGDRGRRGGPGPRLPRACRRAASPTRRRRWRTTAAGSRRATRWAPSSTTRS